MPRTMIASIRMKRAFLASWYFEMRSIPFSTPRMTVPVIIAKSPNARRCSSSQPETSSPEVGLQEDRIGRRRRP